MTIKDETRFRHLAGLLATAATELELGQVLMPERLPLTLNIMQGWLSEMTSLAQQRVAVSAKPKSRNAPRKKSGGGAVNP